LCEKPLTSSRQENAGDARALYAAAAEKNVMLQDALWTRFFPAVEHARWAIESGAIGEVMMVQAAWFDSFYCMQNLPLAFGAGAKPTGVTAAGGKSSGAIVEYGADKCAVLAFPPFNTELLEVTEFVGSAGRITLEQPAHCPTGITIRIPSQVPSLYRTANVPTPVQRFEYPMPHSVGMPMASVNQSGFLYQAEAVHRCLAAGLRECPQYNQEESLHLMDLWIQFNEARRANLKSDRAIRSRVI
jgi:dihydrodiol dehydrogenase / D-xylose 1-dehydrogenase (NADP)